MTMTDERLAELDAALETIGLPICPEWTYSAIRHCQRNMDLDVGDGFNEPDRQCGGSIAEIVNAYPDLRAHIDAQAATIARIEAELEKTTHPHFWWDVDESGNGVDDITSILDNYEIGEVVELSCARSLPNQWAVGYVTESGGFRGQTFATEAEAVEFAAARAALTANHSAPVVEE